MSDATTIEVRTGEELNKENAATFIHEHIPEAPEGELHIRQFSAGHSNLTYLLQIKEWEAVLRRPPLGPVAPKAHDMEREYTILSSLHPYFKPAPKPYVFSDDEEIVGSPFFIMERSNGIVLDTEFPNEARRILLNSDAKFQNYMVEQLVSLHQVDYKKTKL